MASAAAGVAISSGVFAAVPVVGWAVGIGAALIDTYYVMPALQGKKREDARAPRLLDVPVGSNIAGAPRVWAIGARVRVPTHVLWQDTKVRETTANNGNKAGTSVQQRKVYLDAVVALNDRPTLRLRTLTGNGKQLIFSTRNVYGITSSRMTLTVLFGNTIQITALTTLDNDFSNIFAVGDVAELRDWVQTAGARQMNTGYYKVMSVVPHGSAPSVIELRTYDGVPVTGIMATAGNAFSPATIRRVDSVFFSETTPTSPFGPPPRIWGRAALPNIARNIFSSQDALIAKNAAGLTDTTLQWVRDVGFLGPNTAEFRITGGPNLTPLPTGDAFNPWRVEFANDTGFTVGIFPSSFLPANFYRSGTETQGEDALIVAQKGSGNVPGYRGMAYQGLDQFFATQFGDSLPASMEAVIDPDASMDWGRAIQTILVERCNFSPTAVDVSAITQRAFLGAYMRGPVPAITAIQPILIAGQIMAQDRDGVLTFSDFGQADRVAVDNGAALSHFGTRLDGETAADDKWTITDQAVEDLPTKVGVRHQDPDNQYADGYQFFGLRNPEGVEHTNEQELDLSQMVLSRQEAANLAATVLRRSWVNRRQYKFTLPACYLHLLESDLLEWTDDAGRAHLGRIIQRDVGSDFRVAVTCIAEDLDLALGGSPVQSAAGTPPLNVGSTPSLDVVIVDAPATQEGQNRRPGLKIAVGSQGGTWAGAAIYESQDGTTYDYVGLVGQPALVGTLDTDLTSGVCIEAPTSAALVPVVQTVDVTFPPYASTQLQSRTLAEVLGGANWCALVQADGTVEVAAFLTVQALGNNQYRLGTWGRGIRGTWSSPGAGRPLCQTVTAGTRLVVLDSRVFYREFSGETSPTALSYKIVPAGLSLDDVDQINFVNERRNARPLPVRVLTKTINSTTLTARITIAQQGTRTVLPLGTQPPHPMDEPVEAYRVTIYSYLPPGFPRSMARVARVLTLTASGTGTNTIRDRWIDYTAAQQQADGYTPGVATTFTVDVQQIGEHGLGPTIRQIL